MALSLLILSLALAEQLVAAMPTATVEMRQSGNIQTMCNCNNPATKETRVKELCAQTSGAFEKQGVFPSVSQAEINMCIVDSNIEARRVFTDSACKQTYGREWRLYCNSYLPNPPPLDCPLPCGYPNDRPFPQPLPPGLVIPTPPPAVIPPPGCRTRTVNCNNGLLPGSPVCHEESLMCEYAGLFAWSGGGKCYQCNNVWLPAP